MEFSSWRTIQIFGFIYLLLPSGTLSDNLTVYPQDFANQSCDLPNGKEGVCVYGYLCRDSIINIDGNGVIDLRFSDVCEDYFLKCCSKETPCFENKGTCVAASNCGVNLNDSKYKKFKQSDECDWSGYKCCPNNKVGQTNLSPQGNKESCNDGNMCVPHDQCSANLDGMGSLDPRSSVCSAFGHTCCPQGMIKSPHGTRPNNVQNNSIEKYEPCDDNSVCVSDGQCLIKPDGDSVIEARISTCSGRHQTCCPKGQIKGVGYDPCNKVGGTCVHKNVCDPTSSLNFDIRIEQCEEPGFECCMRNETNYTDHFKEKPCSKGSGKCTPRKQCRGTTYRDTNNECGGLACCATLEVPENTTRKFEDGYEGKACFNNNGKCSSENCEGKKYTDRKKDCGGLNCCGKFPENTTPRVTTPTTRTIVNPPYEGQPCHKTGRCTSKQACREHELKSRPNVCGHLICCAAIEATTDETSELSSEKTDSSTPYPDHSCSSIGGECMLEKDCHQLHGLLTEGCDSNEVCCKPNAITTPDPIPEVKDCGYRNEDGVKFNTIGRDDGESQFGEFPWMVSIAVYENGKAKYICGGSLIDPEVVLTTAECVKSFRRTPDKLIVHAGEWDMGSTKEPIPHQERRVNKIKSHSDFKPTTLVNNIALLILDDKFNLGLTINTVCLPPQNFVIDNGEVTATGWGSTPQVRTKYQQILKSIVLDYMKRSDCERTLRKGTRNHSFKLHRSFMCAGGVAGVDTCTGDAGSPIVYPVPDDLESRYYAVGMVSWGVGCGRAGMPAAYTDVAVFRDWIDHEMEREGFHSSYYQYHQQEEEGAAK